MIDIKDISTLQKPTTSTAEHYTLLDHFYDLECNQPSMYQIYTAMKQLFSEDRFQKFTLRDIEIVQICMKDYR